MENVINNTEPMPHTPEGANGKWVWDGHTTARHQSIDGGEWLLKGAWRWVQVEKKAQAPLAKAPISAIVKAHKPTIADNHKINKAFNNLFVVCGSIIAITLITLAIL